MLEFPCSNNRILGFDGLEMEENDEKEREEEVLRLHLRGEIGLYEKGRGLGGDLIQKN